MSASANNQAPSRYRTQYRCVVLLDPEQLALVRRYLRDQSRKTVEYWGSPTEAADSALTEMERSAVRWLPELQKKDDDDE